MNSDFVDLLRLLGDHKVDFLLIGGYAVSFYTEPRYTKDIDIWIDATRQNGKRLISALKEFGAPVDNLTPVDIAKPGLLYIFGVPPLRVDILNRMKGHSFKAAHKKKNIIITDGIKIPLVGLSTLISLKQKAGRPQDLIDLKNLKKIK